VSGPVILPQWLSSTKWWAGTSFPRHPAYSCAHGHTREMSPPEYRKLMLDYILSPGGRPISIDSLPCRGHRGPSGRPPTRASWPRGPGITCRGSVTTVEPRPPGPVHQDWRAVLLTQPCVSGPVPRCAPGAEPGSIACCSRCCSWWPHRCGALCIFASRPLYEPPYSMLVLRAPVHSMKAIATVIGNSGCWPRLTTLISIVLGVALACC